MFTGSKAVASQVTNTTSTAITEDDEGSIPLSNSLDLGAEQPIHQNSPAVGAGGEGIPELHSSSHKQSEVVALPVPTASTATTGIHPNLCSPFPDCPPHPLFAAEQLGIDRRLLVNRKRQLKMYRVWMQGKFRKIAE